MAAPTTERQTTAPPDRHAHRATAEEAGLHRISVLSLLGGLLSAYGLFAIVAGLIAAALDAAGSDTDFRTNDWTSGEAGALLAGAVALFVAYLFGGYVAGRMARRSGVAHGALLVLATLVVGAIAGGVVSGLTDDDRIRSDLRNIGVPTSFRQVEDLALAGIVAALVAMAAGAVLGGMLGERWHTRLAGRLADPTVGRSAADRRDLGYEDDRRRRALEVERMQRHHDLDALQEDRQRTIAGDHLLQTEGDHTADDRWTDRRVADGEPERSRRS